MKVNVKNWIIGLICFMICFLVTAQIKTINKSSSDILRLKTENELRDEINQWKDTYTAATSKINELNAKITEYQNAASKEDKATALIKKELDEANFLVGKTAVKGQGIIITLDDTAALKKIELEIGYDPNYYIIHDSDLLLIINELRAAGAEAISINGQRITNNTEIRCTGPQISINGIKMVAPFSIYAIGEGTILKGALSLRGGIIDSVKSSNIDVSIETKEEITIPAYEKAISYQYAKPIEDGGEE